MLKFHSLPVAAPLQAEPRKSPSSERRKAMSKKRLLSRFKWISVIAFLTGSIGSAAVQPVGLSISPTNPLLFGKDSHQALLVVVSYSDGTSKDVTQEARFESAKARVATVDKAGVVTAHSNGGSP